MKGSFLIKASDLLAKDSIFQGAVVLKIDGIEYLEKGVLFLTPKGFNIRFLLKTKAMLEAEVFTVFLGSNFNYSSLKYFKDEGLEQDLEGIFCFNFDLGKREMDGRENYRFTKQAYPANNFSFYYESSLAKNSFKIISELAYAQVKDEGSISFVFDSKVIGYFLNVSSWTTTKISKAQKEKGFAKIDQALQVNINKSNTQNINTKITGQIIL